MNPSNPEMIAQAEARILEVARKVVREIRKPDPDTQKDEDDDKPVPVKMEYLEPLTLIDPDTQEEEAMNSAERRFEIQAKEVLEAADKMRKALTDFVLAHSKGGFIEIDVAVMEEAQAAIEAYDKARRKA